MNIRAVMAALEEWELDHTAKHALVVLACRADRYTGMVTVSTRRLAADMKVHYDTARLALDRLVHAEYVAVDKSPGLTPIWMLTPRLVRDPTSRIDSHDLADSPRGGRGSGPRTKESLEKTKERAYFAPGSGMLVDFTSRIRREEPFYDVDGDC